MPRSYIRRASLGALWGLACVLTGVLILRSEFNVHAVLLVIEGLLLSALGIVTVRVLLSEGTSSAQWEVRRAKRQELRHAAGYDVRAARKYVKALRLQLKGVQLVRQEQPLSPTLEAFESQVKAEVAKVEARIRLLQ